MEQTAINLLPFLMEAFAVNPKAKKEIDRVYGTNPLKFYSLAKSSKYYKHPFITEGDIFREEYGKRILGILLASDKSPDVYTDDVLKIVKASWPHLYSYVSRHSEIDFIEYAKTFLERPGITDDIFNTETLMLYWLAVIMQKNPKDSQENMEFIKHFESFLFSRLNFIKKDSKSKFTYSTFEPELKDAVEVFKDRIYNEYGKIESYDDIFWSQETAVKKYADALSFLFDTEGLSASSLLGAVKCSKKDIAEILGAHYLVYKNKNKEEGVKFLITGIILKGMMRSYKELKEYYFQHNKETVLLEMKHQDDKIASLEDENIFLKKQVENLKNELSSKVAAVEASYAEEVRKLKDKVSSLTEELEAERQKNSELFALRELMFSLDRQVEIEKEAEDKDIDLSAVRGVIVGGTGKWQQKMKELLPTFTFLSADSENFDPSVLDEKDIIFFYTNYISHAIYYKVVNIARAKGIEIGYINAANEERALNAIKNRIRKLN